MSNEHGARRGPRKRLGGAGGSRGRGRRRGDANPAGSRPIDLSREAVLAALNRLGRPTSLEELADALGASTEEARGVLSTRLAGMRADGHVLRNRKGAFAPVERVDLIRGRVAAHRDGYGFVVPDGGGNDFYLAPREMRTVMHGDRVLVRLKRIDRQGRAEGSLVEILERRNNHVVGRLFFNRGRALVVPDDRRLHHDIVVSDRDIGDAREGDVVVTEVEQPPGEHAPPVGRIVEVLGHHLEPGLEIEIALRSHGIPVEWPDAVLADAAQIPLHPSDADLEGRLDLRHLPFVTIDGADAKDFDDAVYCRPQGDGWQLFVAIADVSHYVAQGSPLDAEARRRGTSAYFPGRVIPMLPERLSNGVCSLNPGVDRQVLVCRMHIASNGRVVRSTFAEAVIRSAARLTYDEVAQGIVEKEREARETLGELIPHLDHLFALYRTLKRSRRGRGALELDTAEPIIVFAPGSNEVVRIEAARRNTAHEIIEECMIAANVCAARFAERHRLPVLYRVHQGPGEEKAAELGWSLSEMGIRFLAGDRITPADFARVLEQVTDRADRELVQTLILRSLAQARYQPKNTGHFGLALPAYAHFTSPIRRYPDLALHRAIRWQLQGRAPQDAPYGVDDMKGLGEHTSGTERRAEEAVRDACASLKCQYMAPRVGERFTGIVSGVTSFGVFVALDEVLVDGLVHVSGLGDDYFHFDPMRHRLIGEQSGRAFRLADPVSVRVARVDIDERRIDFELDLGGGKRDRSRSPRRNVSRSRAGRRKALRRRS